MPAALVGWFGRSLGQAGVSPSGPSETFKALLIAWKAFSKPFKCINIRNIDQHGQLCQHAPSKIAGSESVAECALSKLLNVDQDQIFAN